VGELEIEVFLIDARLGTNISQLELISLNVVDLDLAGLATVSDKEKKYQLSM
jgi:hypothetical protein